MYPSIKNLVFEGGGILEVAYLGVLDYLDEIGILSQIEKIAGSSTGAITACLTCFNTSFNEIKKMASSLDCKKLANEEPLALRGVSDNFKTEFESLFGNLSSVYRLLNNYGWYSTKYIYEWIKKIIATKFDETKKKAPYTFEDFGDEELHINNIAFKDLYIVGTDISYKSSVVFSYETTPKMEVAEAVRISMSIPFFFEAIKINTNIKSIYADGSLTRNFPITLFDENNINYETLGVRFKNKIKYAKTKNILDYIENIFSTLLKVQDDAFNNNYIDQKRTISINTGGIAPLNFNISDDEHKFLYDQGYDAAVEYFEKNYLEYK